PPGVVNQHIFKVTEREPNNRTYMHHAIETAFDEMQRKVVGIGMMHLRRADFLGQHVPCPPSDVQASVGAYLNWLEGCSSETEPELPPTLSDLRMRVAQLRKILDKAERASQLRRASTTESTVLFARTLSEAFPAPTSQTVGDFATVQSGYAFKSE